MMKNIFTSLVAMGAMIASLSAQSFSYNDLAKPDDKIGYAYDTLNRAFPTISTTGAGQHWDFSAFGNHTKDTTYFYDPSTMTDAPPTATLYAQDAYWEADANNLFFFFPITDFQTGTTTYKKMKMASLPMVIGSSIEDSVVQSMFMDPSLLGGGSFPGIDSLRIDIKINISATVDASGEIKLQAATYTNAARHKMQMKTASEIWMHNSFTNTWDPLPGGGGGMQDQDQVTYSWWAAGFNWSVARIIVDNVLGESTQIEYLDGNGPAAGISKSAAGNTLNTVYPNPASGKIYVNLKEGDAREFPVYDANGNVLKKYRVMPGLNELEVENLAPGLYFYELNPGKIERLLVL